jgi:4-amino-4-deoxy-L-arabinose transferase-like glycosyltransferase
VPAAVWAITALFTLSLVFWSLLTPLDEAPDEVGQADLVFHLATGAPYPAWDDRRVGEAMLATIVIHRANVKTSFRDRYLTAKSAPPRDERPDFDQAGGDAQVGAGNQMPQHPPLYYEAGSLLLRAERAVVPGDLAVDQEWHLLRLLNVLMIAPLALLAWAAARRLGAASEVAVAASVVPLAIPQLLHIGSAINNDNLLTLLCGVLAVLLAGVVRGDQRRSTALAVGVVTGLALLTKAFAFVLPLWIAVAYALPALRDRSRLRPATERMAVALCAAAVVGGWWWVVHALREGALSPSIADRAFSGAAPAGFHPDLGFYVPRFGWWLTERFWGNFGYFSVPMTRAVVIAATVVAVAGIVAAFVPWLPWDRPRGATTPRSLELAAFGSLFVLLVGFVAVHAYGLYNSSGKTPFIQGRYLFGALAPFAVVLAVGLSRLVGRWAPLVLFAGAVGMQVDAVRVARHAWWAEPTASIGRSFRALLAWNPWPPGLVWAIVACVGAATAVAAWQLVRLAREPSSVARLR